MPPPPAVQAKVPRRLQNQTVRARELRLHEAVLQLAGVSVELGGIPLTTDFDFTIEDIAAPDRAPWQPCQRSVFVPQ